MTETISMKITWETALPLLLLLLRDGDAAGRKYAQLELERMARAADAAASRRRK